MKEEQIETQIKDLTTHIEGLIEKESKASGDEAKALREEMKGLQDKVGDMLKAQAELDGVKKTNEDIKKEIQEARAEMQKMKDFKNDGNSKTADQLMEEKVKAIYEAKTQGKWNEVKVVGDMTMANFSGDASVGFKQDGVMILPRKTHVRSLLSSSPFGKEVIQYEVESGNE